MSIAIYYLRLLPDIREAARRHGYAVGVHGSMARDFDLIAAPWQEIASPPDVLIVAIKEAVGGTIVPDGTPGGRWDKDAGKFVAATVKNPDAKPHGRLAWCIQLGAGAYIDISVMPPQGGR